MHEKLTSFNFFQRISIRHTVRSKNQDLNVSYLIPSYNRAMRVVHSTCNKFRDVSKQKWAVSKQLFAQPWLWGMWTWGSVHCRVQGRSGNPGVPAMLTHRVGHIFPPNFFLQAGFPPNFSSWQIILLGLDTPRHYFSWEFILLDIFIILPIHFSPRQ